MGLQIDHEPENNHSSKPYPLDPQEFRRQGHMIIDFLADYYENIEQYPVLSQVEPGYLRPRLPESAPSDPEPIETILKDVKDHILPGITHWQSPNFFAYFQCNASIAGILGEMLGTGFNVVGFNWITSPAVTELEMKVMEWLGNLLELPKSFLFSGNGGGVLQGTTCEAVLCTIVAARDQMLSRVGRENLEKLVVYGSDQTHCCFQKAAKIAGINPNNIRSIVTTKATAFGLSPDSLRSAILSDLDIGLIPLFLCATVGTTASTAVDPVGPLCAVTKDYDMWVHVDAACAGSACICPEFRHFIDGIEGANSFSLNAHKWLLTNLDCCCLWLKDPTALIKVLSTNPEYLKNKSTEFKGVVDYKDWQITLSRRFRAMKLWLVLRSYGVENLRSYMRNHVRMAKRFAGLVAMDERFQIVVPTTFALVCFRLLPPAVIKSRNRSSVGDDDEEEDGGRELNQRLLESINTTGQMYMTHAVVGGVYTLRLAVGATLTEDRHVSMAWKVVQEHAESVLNCSGKKENNPREEFEAINGRAAYHGTVTCSSFSS
ncbi:tyrosine decarboxylase-like [Malania oleifera]|uniref:tyrosine decarboxylase-like n=1 Tax=Malania oleifera TaxID=397392 RepID=UPI0025ADA53E|nr:tyrosine decarboxylase-like [Malania oleifera]